MDATRMRIPVYLAQCWIEKGIREKGLRIEALIDTAADISIMPKEIVKQVYGDEFPFMTVLEARESDVSISPGAVLQKCALPSSFRLNLGKNQADVQKQCCEYGRRIGIVRYRKIIKPLIWR